MKSFLHSRAFAWILLLIAVAQFAAVGLPPGNADLLSVQLLAYDLSHGDDALLYPGTDYALNDSWVAHHEQNLRDLHVKAEPNWCFYPPLIPYLCVPFARSDAETWRIVWGAIQIVLALLFALLIERLLVAMGRHPSRILIFALVIGSYPVARSVHLGQTSLWVALAVWSGVYLSPYHRTKFAPLLVGLACFLKPFLIVSELPRVLKRQFASGLIVVLTTIGLSLISLFLVGAHANREYWHLLTTLSRSQTAFSGNQSILAGLLRLFTADSVLDYGFQMDSGLDMLGKGIALIVIGLCLWSQLKSREVPIPLSIGLWFSAVLLALPISWEHHLILLVPVLAILWTTDAVSKSALALTTLALSLSFESWYGNSAAGRWVSVVPLLGNLGLFALLIALHLKSNRAAAVIAVS